MNNENLISQNNNVNQEPIITNQINNSNNKKGIILIALIVLIICVIGYLVYNGTIKTPFTNNNVLSCSLSEYETTFKANISTSVDMKFDKNNFIDKVNGTINYKFDNKLDYDNWKQLYNSNNQIFGGILGMETKTEFNDNERIIKAIINQKYSEIPESNLNSDFPTNYNDLKSYFLDFGYTCNGEVGKKKNDNQNSNNGNNQNNNTSKLYSINEKISATNNMFEYKDYEWSSSFEDSASLWMGTLKNISTDTLKNNIHIKFYDTNKNCIGDYQAESEKEINKEDPFWEVWVLEPNETKNPSFSFYSDNLYEGHSMSEVKYISIEDINF